MPLKGVRGMFIKTKDKRQKTKDKRKKTKGKRQKLRNAVTKSSTAGAEGRRQMAEGRGQKRQLARVALASSSRGLARRFFSPCLSPSGWVWPYAVGRNPHPAPPSVAGRPAA